MNHSLSTTLYLHYDQLSRRLFEARRNVLMSLKTAADAEKYIAEAKRKIEKLLALPGRPKPESRVTGSFRANGTLVDKILFRCTEDRWCSGWFIRREQQERIPGLLFCCGHSANGKFAEAYQYAAFGLALKGFAVLIFDPIGQGEMSQYPDDVNVSAQHNLLGRFCILSGTALAADFIHDARCAIDTLLARPEVLPGPISVTGNSGGGQMSYYLHGLDERIGFSAPSCHMNTFRTIYRNEQVTDAESSPAGMLASGCDRPDFGIIGAPKPLLLIEQDNDFIDPRGCEAALKEIRHIYQLLGKEDNCEYHLGRGNHGFVLNGREAAYGFFTSRVLGKEDSKEPEGIIPVTPEIGNVTPTGKVIEIPGVKSIQRIHLERWGKTQFSDDPDKISAWLRQTLQIENLTPETPDHRILRPVYLSEGGCFGRWAWNTDRGSFAEAVLCKRDKSMMTRIPSPEKARLLIAEHSSAEELTHFPAEEDNVFSLDMRGIGESQSGAGPASGEYGNIFGPEYFLDNSGRLMGELLAGGRVRDILAAVTLLRNTGCREITLEGRGHAGMMIAYAAAMGQLQGVVKIELQNMPESFRQEDPMQRAPIFLFGMLKQFDLPQLYQAVRHFNPQAAVRIHHGEQRQLGTPSKRD